MKAYHVKISGRVQGVWFRARTQEEAIMLGVSGWVRNLPDGSVEAFMQGEEDRVDALLSWCYTGPAGARVTDVEYGTAEIDESVTGFRVRH